MTAESNSFSEFNLNKQLISALDLSGITTPTQIQKLGIPRILGGQDLVGLAPTGTGKTIAYLLPILMKLKYASGDHPRALVLVPTRELCLQVESVCKMLCGQLDLRIVSLYGGLGPKSQIENISRGSDIIVATPGRLMEIYFKGVLQFKQLAFFVVDEADKMMDMGFMPQLRKILEIIPRKRQNLLFSATMSDRVEKLVEEFIENPSFVEVAARSAVVETVGLQVFEAPNFLSKIALVGWLLRQNEGVHTIIFVRKRIDADNVFKFINRKINPKVRVIHANKGQNSRINAMKAFSVGEISILVATDVAARGIDIKGVGLVINFDMPLVLEDFVHRVGRTGRAEEHGQAITLISPEDQTRLEKTEKAIGQKIARLLYPSELAKIETDSAETKRQAKDIDDQKKKADPTFKGAFHEKKQVKRRPTKKGRSGNSAKRR